MIKQTYPLFLFGKVNGNIRMVNTGKPKNDSYILRIQVQHNIFGITYWRTIFETTEFSVAENMYKALLLGHPDFEFWRKRTK